MYGHLNHFVAMLTLIRRLLRPKRTFGPLPLEIDVAEIRVAEHLLSTLIEEWEPHSQPSATAVSSARRKRASTQSMLELKG